MNTTKTEPVKDANLPSTSQSLIAQENENICELMDLIESDGFCSENVESMDFNSTSEFESLFKKLVEEIGLGNSQKILLGQDTGLSAAIDSNRNTGLTMDSDMRLNTGLVAASDSNPTTGLTTDSDSNPDTGLTMDSDMRLNTGLVAASDSNPNTGLTTDSDSNRNTGLTMDSDMRLNTGLVAASDSNPNTGLTTDSDLNPNTGLTTDSDMILNTGLSVDSGLKLNTQLAAGSDIRLNRASLVDSDLKVNAGLLGDSDLKELNSELSADNKLKTLNTGSSADSFCSRAEGRTVKGFEGEVQLKPLLADIEEKNDNILAVAESRAESSSSVKVTAGKYEVAPTSNQSQELSVTSLYDVSQHIGSTAPGQSLLNRSPVPATVTVQALDILHDSVVLETVATAAYDDPGTGDGEMIISVQSDTKEKIEINSCDIMACDSTSAEKLFGVLSAEISHSVTNSDNGLTENRTDIISAEVGTPKLTPYTAIDRGGHSCTGIRDENAVAPSPELLGVAETSCSVRAAGKVVSEKKGSDGIAEVGTPVSIACINHSYLTARYENGTAVTKHSFVSENSVPVTVDIENMIRLLSVPNTGSLTVDVLSVALDDVHMAENVKVSWCDDASMSSGTEIKETIVRGLNLETNSSTAKNMFPRMNSIADASQQNLTTHASVEVAVTDSGRAMASGVPIMLEKLMSEGKSHTLQTNCAPGTAAETANLKSDNTCVEQYTDTTVCDMDILERLPVTTKARCSVTSRSSYTGISCPQSPVVSSDVQQKETGNRAHVQRSELCSESRAQCVGMNINSMLDLDGHQYSCSTYVKNGGCITNSQMPCGAEVKKGLLAESQNHVAHQTVRIGDSLNSCVVTHRDNVPLPDLSKLEGKVASATYVNPHVLPTCLPYQQNLNSVHPLFPDSSAAVSQKGAKHHMTAPKAEQSKRNGICTSSRMLLSKPSDVKLRNTQQSKLNTKEVNINKIRSYLKSHTAFPGSNKDKFSGFIFEKPFVPEGNLSPCSKKKKISKTESFPKGRKTHSEQNELLPRLKNNPHPDRSNSNSSSTDSGNRVTMLANHGHVEGNTVENSDVADHVCVENKSDDGSLDWLQQLLM
jgi:hypothetical protein